jgi:hypothetical protein
MKAVYVLVRYPLGNNSLAQPTLSKELSRVVVRTLLDRLNISQTRWVLPSSTTAYNAWISKRAKKEGTPAEVVTELIDDDGAKLHWIGNKDAKKVLLHFHSESDITCVCCSYFEHCNSKAGVSLCLCMTVT